MSRQNATGRGAPTREGGETLPRTNAYFHEGSGISREVIQADICRYLGNNALVKPGTGQDSSGRVVQGFIINAYRDLTSQMIADIKADSARWEADAARERVPYRESQIHQSRQYYGPSNPAPAAYEAPAPTYQSNPGYHYETAGPNPTPGYVYTNPAGAYPPTNTFRAGGDYGLQQQEAPRTYQASSQPVPDPRYPSGYAPAPDQRQAAQTDPYGRPFMPAQYGDRDPRDQQYYGGRERRE